MYLARRGDRRGRAAGGACAGPPSPASSCRCCAGRPSRTRGSSTLLDGVVDYLPSPAGPAADRRATRPTAEAEARPQPTRRAASPPWSFKIVADPYVGSSPSSGSTPALEGRLLRATTPPRSSKERISRLLQMHANQQEDDRRGRGGDIVAVVGLKRSTGDTLCDEDTPSSWRSSSRSR